MNNQKHQNIFTPEIMKDYLVDRGYKNVFVSGVDLYDAFLSVGEKQWKKNNHNKINKFITIYTTILYKLYPFLINLILYLYFITPFNI